MNFVVCFFCCFFFLLYTILPRQRPTALSGFPIFNASWISTRVSALYFHSPDKTTSRIQWVESEAELKTKALAPLEREIRSMMHSFNCVAKQFLNIYIGMLGSRMVFLFFQRSRQGNNRGLWVRGGDQYKVDNQYCQWCMLGPGPQVGYLLSLVRGPYTYIYKMELGSKMALTILLSLYASESASKWSHTPAACGIYV